MMKKHPKARQFMLSAIASSLLAMPAVASAKKVTISQEPLLGVSKVIPTIVLAVSVEFPTALPAYVKQEFDLTEAKTKHLGYFDSDKCYRYVLTTEPGQAGGFKDTLLQAWGEGWSGFVGDGYFEESGDAQTNGDYVGLCPGDLDWSGNMLNFMSMSALDVFRQTLTGGNRAKGVGASNSVYTAGDPADVDLAYLRRAMLWRGTEDQEVFPDSTGQEQVNADYGQKRLFAPEIYENGFISNFVPKGFVDEVNRLIEKDRIVKAGKGYDGHFAVKMQSGKLYRNYQKTQNDPNGPNRWSDVTGDSWHNQMAEGGVSGTVDINNSTLDSLRTMIDQMYDRPIVFENAGTGFYGTLQGRSSLPIPTNTTTTTTAQVPWFNVVVKKSEKPTGLLQESPDMRTAVIGYLNEKPDGTSAGDGGVLRAKMARVVDKEIASDGSFVINPYPTDASASGVTNSGVINYVNKFGDRAQYDNKDPVSELYYTAIRYLRNGAWTDGETKPNAGSKLPYELPKNLESYHKDGFPVITDWDDPLRGPKDKDEDMQCYLPSIVVLGDINTHDDGNLPNFKTKPGVTGITDDNVAKEKNGTTSYQKVCELQGRCATSKTNWFESSGANSNDNGRFTSLYAPTWGLAGMAYWVKTNNVRPDIIRGDGKPTHITSFFIDVLESGMLKTLGDMNSGTTADSDEKILNSYYLAGKFAAPDYEAGRTYTAADFNSKTGNRSLWTKDPWDPSAKNNGSSSEYYPLGMPKNYAIGNNPQNMRDALYSAFKTVGFTKNTMQSAIQSNGAGSASLHIFDKTNGSVALIGKGINKITNDDDSESYQMTDEGKTALIEKAKQGEVPLSLRAGYKFSERTGFLIASVLMPGLKDKNGNVSNLAEVKLWDGGENLFRKYHNGSYTDRQDHVWSKTGTNIVGGFTQLNPNNTDLQAMVRGSVFEDDDTNYFTTKLPVADAGNLIRYILGDISQETAGVLRQRKNSLLGTSVYSSVTPIIKNTKDDYVKTVPLGAYNEKTCYYKTMRSQDYAAMSSNEGMLHIFDMTGNEVFAYMPQTALPFIANFASPDYDTQEHRFVNDGPSLLHEVCEISGDSGEAKAYLVGTSGRGASSIYAIDVTNDGFTPKLEINAKNDPDIGILVSGPLVVNDGKNTPVLIFSSGYNPKSGKNEGYLFFYNLKTGDPIAKVKLGGSGVGAPFGYDSDEDGVADRIYVGDNDGHIWRVNRNSDGTWNGITEGQKLLDCTSNCQPITTRPVVGRVNGGKTVVLAGTGENFHLDDMRDHKQNYAYGIFDEDGTTTVSSNSTDLLKQNFGTEKETSKTNEKLTYLSVTQNDLEDHHKGWRLQLPTGYVISSDSAFYGPKNQIATYTAVRVKNEGNSACNVSGSSLFIAVDAQNGGAYDQSLFDRDGDGRFNKSDFVGGASAGGVEVDERLIQSFNIFETDHSDYNDVLGADNEEATGFGIVKFLSTGTIRRVSWREIF